jgi:hypothetical protein
VIASEEEVVVPAGRFLARKVEVSMADVWRSVSWFVRGVGVVKFESVIDHPKYPVHAKGELQEYWIPGQVAQRQAIPPAVYADEGACPFECCIYMDWSVNEETTLYDRKDRTGEVIAVLKPSQVVKVRTGVVWTKPGKMVVLRDHGLFRKGEVVYLLTYKGEGFFKIWRDGEILSVDVSCPAEPPGSAAGSRCWHEIEKDPESTWWVQIETSSGRVGWTDQPQNFGNKDACG